MSTSRVVDHGRVRALQFQNLPRQSAGGKHGDDGVSKEEYLAVVEREAYQKGFEAGRVSGLEMAEKKVEAILGRFTESLEDLAALRSRIVQETQEDLVRLSLAVAQKLVYREIKLDSEIVVTLVRVALDRLNAKAPVEVYLNPDDLRFIEARLNETPDLFGERSIVLKARKELRRGDCLCESPYGNVDARLSEQFNQIEQGLLGEF